ncbi:hypothetical protein FA13DRAFT_377141 [Coprinellus micaceus]|uniref:Uncharacterized protein n=1 Tax=Coprinellus micaceus TaxID=71717 RepID=A0A4Y7SCC6_COPMI|nr:hypothetical protein FA13DRAFT_377141 [Coprinellus micaceus]
MEGYTSQESQSAGSMSSGDARGLLHISRSLCPIYFEVIPRSKRRSSRTRVLTCWEFQQGVPRKSVEDRIRLKSLNLLYCTRSVPFRGAIMRGLPRARHTSRTSGVAAVAGPEQFHAEVWSEGRSETQRGWLEPWRRMSVSDESMDSCSYSIAV